MKNVIVLVFALLLAVPAEAEKKKTYCPVVIDVSTGTYVKTGVRYKCMKESAAKKAGYLNVNVFGQEPVPTAAPSNNFSFSGTGSKNSTLFTITNTQTLVQITKPKNCFFDLDFKESDGSFGENVIMINQDSSQTSASTYVYAPGTYYLDVVSYCSGNWSVTVFR